MSHLTTTVKITNFVDQVIKDGLNSWMALLAQGKLLQFEQELSTSMLTLYNIVCEGLLCAASEEVVKPLMEQGKAAGARKMEVRSFCVRVATGHCVELRSPYVKQVPEGWQQSRHLLVDHWSLMGGAAPALYDRVGFCCALGPSYDLAHQTLKKFGVNVCLSSVRDLSNRLSDKCFHAGEENLMLTPADSLAGKRVVISIDGGRTRTRTYDEAARAQGQLKYQTNWCEPKLFVIQVLNEEGQPQRQEAPIYGCRFGESDLCDVLGRYLRRLQVEQAEQVQLLADGAPWIWNQVGALLLDLKVAPERIVQTLDYYHASQYVHDLVDQMPKRVGQKQRRQYYQQFKEWLWQGANQRIVEQCRAIYQRPGKFVSRWIKYLEKHQDKTQYAVYEQEKLMCGSGIIESGVRRIINLRFKNASTFWDKQTVEKLYFLRAALLSKRWDVVMQNLAT